VGRDGDVDSIINIEICRDGDVASILDLGKIIDDDDASMLVNFAKHRHIR
jgi:hypothetical protein